LRKGEYPSRIVTSSYASSTEIFLLKNSSKMLSRFERLNMKLPFFPKTVK
jgi:hypothetical protein